MAVPTNRQIRAVFFLIIVMCVGLIMYLPTTQSYIYEHAYIGGVRSGREGYINNEPGWSTNIVVVSCPFNPEKKIIHTDPRYTDAEGKAYCESYRKRYIAATRYLQPILLGIFLLAALYELRASWVVQKPHSATDKKLRNNKL